MENKKDKNMENKKDKNIDGVGKIKEIPKSNIPVVIQWVFVDDNPPEIDQDDKWNKEDKISKDVLTISEYGLRWGRFYHRSGNWSIDGITSSKKLLPEYWSYIVLPCISENERLDYLLKQKEQIQTEIDKLVDSEIKRIQTTIL